MVGDEQHVVSKILRASRDVAPPRAASSEAGRHGEAKSAWHGGEFRQAGSLGR